LLVVGAGAYLGVSACRDAGHHPHHTTVVALAPAGPAGPVSVNVTTVGGVSNSRTYTRVPPPDI
ncbi:hypothetical protein ABZ063_47405, partial [Streptomyces sp. NPDC006333]